MATVTCVATMRLVHGGAVPVLPPMRPALANDQRLQHLLDLVTTK
jgi:hypothetical protein